jgi:hypothetical protein
MQLRTERSVLFLLSESEKEKGKKNVIRKTDVLDETGTASCTVQLQSDQGIIQ